MKKIMLFIMLSVPFGVALGRGADAVTDNDSLSGAGDTVKIYHEEVAVPVRYLMIYDNCNVNIVEAFPCYVESDMRAPQCNITLRNDTMEIRRPDRQLSDYPMTVGVDFYQLETLEVYDYGRVNITSTAHAIPCVKTFNYASASIAMPDVARSYAGEPLQKTSDTVILESFDRSYILADIPGKVIVTKTGNQASIYMINSRKEREQPVLSQEDLLSQHELPFKNNPHTIWHVGWGLSSGCPPIANTSNLDMEMAFPGNFYIDYGYWFVNTRHVVLGGYIGYEGDRYRMLSNDGLSSLLPENLEGTYKLLLKMRFLTGAVELGCRFNDFKIGVTGIAGICGNITSVLKRNDDGKVVEKTRRRTTMFGYTGRVTLQYLDWGFFVEPGFAVINGSRPITFGLCHEF